ncbi:enolase C-terminal domain-like protein [Pseudobacteriovorax antillogorgiicola]|uniref:O-succinylbenzoate synthase n=1 Tax=Pseudobacteriovorax antillogorgiicola TaxID=1513793 RepID=A0A1Y6BA23_9BACT|nr:enolase C-terminal domain-like protein [Pseudobacteriovorax antillogorgiicola]TCS58887.1 O-succinylbenzoate synthase [Pseudobacteriovorax antillogorgiicola]SME93582.1 O-succinylbenzoate synthase [Pseudobacteriovorax antillogorgiicola]
MIIHEIKVEQVHLPFVRSFRHQGRDILGKDLAILTVYDEHQRLYRGEIGPLSGVHRENLRESISALSKQKPEDLGESGSWPLHRHAFGSPYHTGIASLDSAWEQVLFQRWLDDKGSQSEFTAPIAGLITLDRESNALQDLLKQNFKSIKVKLGRDSFDAELKALEQLVDTLASGTRLRLDANQSLSTAQVRKLWDKFYDQIEFFEEPFPSLEQNLALDGVPIALDECLWDRELDELAKDVYVVVKPMRLGLSRAFEWLAKGHPKDRLILSSCFDSGIALRSYLRFIQHFELSASHGLGTYEYLAHDVMESRMPWEGSTMKLEEGYSYD